MKLQKLIFIISVMLSGFLLVCAAATDPNSVAAVNENAAPQVVVDFVKGMNDHRASKGLKRLIWDKDVYRAAQAHSVDMQTRNFFAHKNPNGENPGNRLAKAGVKNTAWGENIAAGQSTGAQVLQSWLNSPGHKSNIENAIFTHHGVSYVKGATNGQQHIWTHKFIRK